MITIEVHENTPEGRALATLAAAVKVNPAQLASALVACMFSAGEAPLKTLPAPATTPTK